MAKQLHAVFGTDEGAMSEEALRLFEKLKPADSDDFTNEVIEGIADNAEHAYQLIGNVLQAVQTLPFFGSGKVVWLKNASFLGNDRTSEAERTKEGVESLTEILRAGLSEGIIFIVSAVNCDKRRGFYKLLSDKSIATLTHFDKPDMSRDDWQESVAEIVEKRSRDLGLHFASDALQYFIMQAGAETRQIRQELEKLDLYLGDRRNVTIDDVRLMIPLTHQGIIFEIGRAIEKRNAIYAMKLIDQQLYLGESAVAIIRAAIIPTVRNLYYAAAIREAFPKMPFHSYNSFKAELERMPKKQIAWLPKTKAGTVNAWGIFSAIASSKHFTIEGLQKILEATHRADKALVFSGLDHRMLLHRLIAEITAQQIQPNKKLARK